MILKTVVENTEEEWEPGLKVFYFEMYHRGSGGRGGDIERIKSQSSHA